MRLIRLTADDDLTSLCDQLRWARATRVVLVLPATSDLLTTPLELVRLRRHADQLRQEVGLVTADDRLIPLARAHGFPIFTTPNQARDERRWRRGKRRTQNAGFAPPELRQLHEEARIQRHAQRTTPPPPAWRRWLVWYGVLVGIVALTAVGYVAAAMLIPGATLTLRPYTEPLTVTIPVIADPALSQVNMATAAVPARLLTITAVWQADVPTTGQISVPATPARGKVLFINQTNQAVEIPAGTRLSTAEETPGTRQVVQTITPVRLPAVVGGTAEVDVVALAAGPQGNLPANQIVQAEGALAGQVIVRNPEPLAGGGLRPAPAVTEADRVRLEAQVTQLLQTAALNQMQSLLTANETLPTESLRVTRIVAQTFSHQVGEQAERLSLALEAEVQGTAVNHRQALDLVYNGLAQQVRGGYTLVPSSFYFYAGGVLGVDGQGRVQLEVVGEARMAADLELEPHLGRVAGQPTAVAMQYLYEQLPLQTLPTAQVLPDWFGRLPYLPSRMVVVVED